MKRQYSRTTLKASIHFLTWSYNLISFCWSNLNLTSAYDRVLGQIGIQLALFTLNSGHLIAGEIVYHTWCTPHSCQLPETDCWLWSIKPRLPLWTQYIACFSFCHCWHHPTNADNTIICKFFLFVPAPRMIRYQFWVIFVSAAICQSVVVCPLMVTITHICTSIRRCLDAWQSYATRPPQISCLVVRPSQEIGRGL